MKTLVLHITIGDGHDSQELYDLLSKAECVDDYEFIDEFKEETPCSACGGSGQDDSCGSSPCGACEGTGIEN